MFSVRPKFIPTCYKLSKVKFSLLSEYKWYAEDKSMGLNEVRSKEVGDRLVFSDLEGSALRSLM